MVGHVGLSNVSFSTSRETYYWMDKYDFSKNQATLSCICRLNYRTGSSLT